MATVISELYFALIEAGASPEKAEAAADVALWRGLKTQPTVVNKTKPTFGENYEDTTEREPNRLWWLAAINLALSLVNLLCVLLLFRLV